MVVKNSYFLLYKMGVQTVILPLLVVLASLLALIGHRVLPGVFSLVSWNWAFGTLLFMDRTQL